MIFTCFSFLNCFIFEISQEDSVWIEYAIMSCMIGSLGILLFVDSISTIYELISKFKKSKELNKVNNTQIIQEDNLNLSGNITQNTQQISQDVFNISFKFYYSVFRIRPESNLALNR